MTFIRHFTLILLFPFFSFSSNAQMSISWKWIDKKPLSAPIGKGGADNYKEEWGGYDMTIDISKVNCKLPVSILVMFYREKDVWHPLYKNFPTLVNWDNLEMEPLTIETTTNRIANTSSSVNPKDFEDTWALEITRNTKAPFTVFVPSGLWIGDNYGEKPSDYFANTLVVRYFPKVEIHDADERFIRQMWKNSPNFSVNFDLSTPQYAKVEDLGEEDLSDLLDDDKGLKPTPWGVELSPQAASSITSWHIITICRGTTDESSEKNKPDPRKDAENEPHQHKWVVKSVANDPVKHPQYFSVSQPWPDSISVRLNDALRLTCFHTKDERYLSRDPLTVDQLAAVYSSQLEGKDFPSSDQAVVNLEMEYAHDVIAELNKLAEKVNTDLEFFIPTQNELVGAGICKAEDFKNFSDGNDETLSPHGELYVSAAKKDNGEVLVSEPYYTVLVTYCRMCIDCHLVDKVGSRHTFRFYSKENAERFSNRRKL